MAPKVRVRRDRKFLNLSTFTSIFMILISTILIAISSLDLAGVISFRYFDPNWLANLDLNQLLDQLPADWNNMENTAIFDYQTDYEGTLLFRTQSYGDYSKNWLTGKWNWADAPRYDTTGDEVVPQNIFAAKIQSQSKLRPHSITVTPRQNLGANAVVPLVSYIPPMLENGFYTEEGLPPDGDKGFRGDKPSYEFTFYGYDDISSSIIEAPIRDSAIKKAAETYSSFAKQRYLTIDDESKNQLRDYAMARGIREDSPTLVQDLIRFVKNDNYYPISVGDDGRPRGHEGRRAAPLRHPLLGTGRFLHGRLPEQHEPDGLFRDRIPPRDLDAFRRGGDIVFACLWHSRPLHHRISRILW